MAESSGTGNGEFAVFELPKLQFNEDGWGPTWEVPQNFRDMPYQPFCKSDRMGKISDWTGNALTDKKFPSKSQNKPNFQSNITSHIPCRQIRVTIRFRQPVRLLPRRG